MTPENIVDWFDNEAIVNYISGILVEDFEITDINKAIQDIEKIYLKEGKISRRNEIIKLLENRESLTSDEQIELEKELNNLIIDLVRMKQLTSYG